MAHDIKYYTEEARHHAAYAARWTGGFMMRSLLNVVTGGSTTNLAIHSVSKLSTATAASSAWMYGFGLIGLVAGTGIRAYLNHKEREHQDDMLALYFKEEISAKLKKGKERVTRDDLYKVAETNPTLQKQIAITRRKMNFRTLAWFASALIATAAVVAAFSFLSITAVGLTAYAVGGLVGSLAHQAAEMVIENVGEKALGLHEPSIVDRVHGLELQRRQGKQIGIEQVLGVYAASSPDLQEMITREFGKPFDSLKEEQQREAAKRYASSLKLAEIAESINDRRMTTKELVFRVHGDESGAYPKPTLREKALETIKPQLEKLQKGIAEKRAQAQENFNQFSGKLLDTGRGWVESLGLAKKAPVVQQSWGDAVMMPAAGVGGRGPL